MVKAISREQVNAMIRKNEEFVLIEALPEKYFNEAHLPGAVQMDYTEVVDRAADYITDKERKIVVYCASTECLNSSKAAKQLDSLGYSNVYEYAEGKQDWVESGLPVESN